MLGVIFVTDYDWFQFLGRQPDLDEVNFWRPSDTRTPQQLKPGTPVLFKLRKRYGNWIVGWGVFAKHDVLPAWWAWDLFGVKNGAATFAEMRQRIERLRPGHSAPRSANAEYNIGCLMLASPMFLPRDSWVRPPADWPENAVQGKAYDLSRGEGARVWRECQERTAAFGVPPLVQEPSGPRHGEPMLIRPRLGQGLFRVSVADAYRRACAVTGEHSLPALEAAHIRPFEQGGEHRISNGLLLRSDIHKLFDRGYVGVTPDLRFIVSDQLRHHFSNGRSYYPLHGQEIARTESIADRPDPSALEWHLSECFLG